MRYGGADAKVQAALEAGWAEVEQAVELVEHLGSYGAVIDGLCLSPEAQAATNTHLAIDWAMRSAVRRVRLAQQLEDNVCTHVMARPDVRARIAEAERIVNPAERQLAIERVVALARAEVAQRREE